MTYLPVKPQSASGPGPGRPGSPLTCVGCAGSLAGVSAAARCPHCGTPYQESLKPRGLFRLDYDWLQQTWILLAVWALCLSLETFFNFTLWITAFVGYIGLSRPNPPDLGWSLTIAAAARLVQLMVVWQLTAPDPTFRYLGLMPPFLAWAARAAALLALGFAALALSFYVFDWKLHLIRYQQFTVFRFMAIGPLLDACLQILLAYLAIGLLGLKPRKEITTRLCILAGVIALPLCLTVFKDVLFTLIPYFYQTRIPLYFMNVISVARLAALTLYTLAVSTLALRAMQAAPLVNFFTPPPRP